MNMHRSIAAAAIVALVLAVSACGSSDSGTSGGTSAKTASSAAAAPGGDAAVKAELGKYLNAQKDPFPTPPGPVAAGKHRIAYIAQSLSDPYGVHVTKWVGQAIKQIGWTMSPTWDSMSQPAKAAGYIRQAISQHYDAIILSAQQVSTVKAAIDEAVAAKIPIVCIACISKGYESSITDIRTDPVVEGDAIGAQAVSMAAPNGTIILVKNDEFDVIKAFQGETTKYIQQHCPGCKISTTNFTVADLAKPGPPVWISTLAQNPIGTAKVAIAPFNGAGVLFGKTEEQRGRTDIPILSYQATQPFIQGLQNKDGNLAGITCIPHRYEVWSAVDLLARRLNNSPLWDATKLPAGLVTSTNASQCATDGASWTAEGSVPDVFAKYWNAP
jgi:ribose transport system substrate-binding protein